MNAVRQKFMQDIDETAGAIRQLKIVAHKLSEASTTQADCLYQAEDAIRLIYERGVLSREFKCLDALQKIEDRIKRLRELRNMSEYGSFEIMINNEMEKISQKLP